MMRPRHISKVFLDSRYTLPDGAFVIPGEALLLEPTSRCWLGEFTCVASWDTIDDTNDHFTVIELGVSRVVTIPTGPHDLESLRQAIEDGLNDSPGAGMGTYSVDRVSTGTGGSTSRAFRVSNTAGAFAIPLTTNLINGICNWPTGNVQNTEHTSSFVDARRVHSIYMHTDFGAHNCVAPTGARSVMAKIPVSVGYGGLVQVQLTGSEHDFVEAGSHSLSTIRLTLHDAAGRELDLKGTRWSCTLIFDR